MNRYSIKDKFKFISRNFFLIILKDLKAKLYPGIFVILVGLVFFSFLTAQQPQSPNTTNLTNEFWELTNGLTREKSKISKIRELQEIVVRGQKRVPSSETISKKELIQSPQINFNDVLSTLKLKPGISSSGSTFDSTLYIQGGDNDEYVTLFDHVYILNPNSWNNRVSLFNPLITESIELYKAGYPASLGNGLSGALWLKSIVPDTQKWNFYFAFDSSLEVMGHGPLGENTSMVIQVRRTLVEIFAPVSDRNSDKFSVEDPYLWDALLKFNFNLSQNDILQVLLFYVRDGITLDINSMVEIDEFNKTDTTDPVRFGYNNNRIIGSLKYVHYFHPDDFLVATFSIIPQFGEYVQDDDGTGAFTLRQNDYPFQFTLDGTIDTLKNNTLNFGGTAYFLRGEASFDGISYFISNVNTNDTNAVWQQQTTSLDENRDLNYFNFYVMDDWEIVQDVLIFQLGLHFNYSSGNNEFQIHPRGGIKYNPISSLGLFFRSGLYNYSDFLRTPDLKSEKSVHYTGGIEYKNRFIRVLAEAFHKDYWDISAINANAIGVISEDNQFLNESQRSFYNTSGTRQITGASFTVEMPESKKTHVSGYLTYTYQTGEELVREQNGTLNVFADPRTVPPVNESFHPQYLRNHIVSSSIKLKPFISLIKPSSSQFMQEFLQQSLGITISYLSERRITPIADVLAIKDAEGVTRFQLISGEYNSDTLPPIINLTLKYTWPIGKNFESFLTLANILNNVNAIDYRYGVTDGAKEEAKSLSNGQSRYLGSAAVQRQAVGSGSDLEFSIRGGFRVML